jgi:hypothetical protein
MTDQVSKLVWLIGEVESDNNPHASLEDYVGNLSVEAQYQQSAAYVKTWGAGPEGIEKQARSLLSEVPKATIGNFYSEYNHGSVLPWATYARRFPLQARNFLTKARAQGYDQNTLLLELLEAKQ